MDERDELCPGNCGEGPRKGCGCQDDGEQYRLPRSQWPDANPARRLTLRRETLRLLAGDELPEADGGPWNNRE